MDKFNLRKFLTEGKLKEEIKQVTDEGSLELTGEDLEQFKEKLASILPPNNENMVIRIDLGRIRGVIIYSPKK